MGCDQDVVWRPERWGQVDIAPVTVTSWPDGQIQEDEPGVDVAPVAGDGQRPRPMHRPEERHATVDRSCAIEGQSWHAAHPVCVPSGVTTRISGVPNHERKQVIAPSSAHVFEVQSVPMRPCETGGPPVEDR